MVKTLIISHLKTIFHIRRNYNNACLTRLPMILQQISLLQCNSQSERTAARLRSVQGRGAGGWLEVIPTSDTCKYAIRSNEFSLASHLRLGSALPFTNFINECDCGKELDKDGYHLLTCKYGGVVRSGPIIV